MSRQYFAKKVCFSGDLNMLRLRAGSRHEDCLAANYRSTGPQQQNTNDHSCPFDTVKRSSSTDWQTADVDD